MKIKLYAKILLLLQANFFKNEIFTYSFIPFVISTASCCASSSETGDGQDVGWNLANGQILR